MVDNQGNFEFGMIGLGTMGRNLLLNMADHGIKGAGYDKDAAKSALLEEECINGNAKGFTDITAFTRSLRSPRAIIMLVPAGRAVDSVIEELLPLLDKGDILIDAGNSHFTDTDRRVSYLQMKGLHFFGMGISGGEDGARNGPSMMPGGDKKAYESVKPVLEAIAARADGVPCVTYIGLGSAGHFVKMVHNGIEYGIMQLIAETYGFMKQGLQMDNEAIHQVFTQWNKGRLQSFLMEITGEIFNYKEPESSNLLLDDIKDEAKAKGTGKWTSQAAMDLQSPIPTIDTAVSMRDLSKYKAMREKAAAIYSKNPVSVEGDKQTILKDLEHAFYFSMVVTYSQGMHMLFRASAEYNYGLNLAGIASIWRGGCIIRSLFLNDIYNAYKKDGTLEHLLLDEEVVGQVTNSVPGARSVLTKAISAGIAMPAFTSALGYFDSFRTGRMPSNLIMAQRDYFGAHMYELIGKEGIFHTHWGAKSVGA